MKRTEALELMTALDQHGWVSRGYCKIEDKHKPNFFVEIGDRVHLKSKNGIYTIEGFDKGISFVVLNCWRWKQLGKPPIKVHISDIKCKAGRPGDKKRREEAKKFEKFLKLLQIIESE